MSTFILIKKDGFTPGGTHLQARTIAGLLLEAKLWPIYKGTRNRDQFAPGDRVLVYVVGDMQIIGEALIEKIVQQHDVRMPIALDDFVHSVLVLGENTRFSFDVEGNRAALSFIPAHHKWGVCFMGGARRISDDDYQTIKRLSTAAIEPNENKRNGDKGRRTKTTGENPR